MARNFSKAFYKSKEWQKVREYCLKRDKYLCQHCGAPAEEVHHIIHLSPDNIGDPSITLNADNLVCLCRDCHFDEHRQDKLNGINRKVEEKTGIKYDYEFDENGFLIQKDSPG